MEIITINNKTFLTDYVENVTQPDLLVTLRVQTNRNPDVMRRMEMILHYMKDQCQLLIPYFYELRNHVPLGRYQQIMARRANVLNDESRKKAYLDLINVDDFQIGEAMPLQTVTVRGESVTIDFACNHDKEHIMFQRSMKVPFSNEALWREVEAFYEKVQQERNMSKALETDVDEDSTMEVA